VLDLASTFPRLGRIVHRLKTHPEFRLMPKKRAIRKAVSAVTDRSPLTMAPMRVAGTRNAMASAFADIPRGRKNSSLSTSPGWVVTRLRIAAALVVVDDFDIWQDPPWSM
jgi:hypothetical protein